ncbi:unnamed protein product, partial [Dracunculus medinensis]|uniref:Peroxisome assembly protein 12 n=1 Tax=Dracunculus medinensis TaxID=318479 RepID=A0A0N4UC04_DRAME
RFGEIYLVCRIFDVIWRIFIRLFFYISRLLGFGLFFLEFLEYWRTMGPSITAKTDRFIVLSVSGYVFCYFCINRYILEHKKCPVTFLPASIEDLIRLRR